MYQEITVVITTEIKTAGYLEEIFLESKIKNIAKTPINKVVYACLSELQILHL